MRIPHSPSKLLVDTLSDDPALQKNIDDTHRLILSHLEKELGDDRRYGHHDPDQQKKTAVLFSGGLDSALLAHIVSQEFFKPKLYSIGFKKSNDLNWSKEAADLMGLYIEQVVIDVEDIEMAIKHIVHDIGMDNPKWMAVFIPFYLILSQVEESSLILGQGADEVFGGYRKYREVDEKEAQAMMDRDIMEIIESEASFYHKMGGHFGKRLILPYLDPAIIEYGKTIPFAHKINEDQNKRVLRLLAEDIGLPSPIAQRPKKAMQYGTGVSKELKKILKRSGTGLEEYIAELK